MKDAFNMIKPICLAFLFTLGTPLWGSDGDDDGRVYILTSLDFYRIDDEQEGLAPGSRAEVGLTLENVTTTLEANFSHLFEKHGLEVNEDFDWEQFVGEATVKIQDIGGESVAVIVGKQTMPFGLGFLGMPLPFFWNNSAEYMRWLWGLMGATVELSELSRFQNVVDKVELAIFESSRDWDFDIQEKPAFSMRVSKTIETDDYEHEIIASYARIDNDHLNDPTGDEERISLGFVTKTPSTDRLILWGEGVYFKNNPFFLAPDKRFVISTGVVGQITEEMFLSGEYSLMEDVQKSYAGAVWYRPFSKDGQRLTFGVEYRHTDFDSSSSENDHYIGALMRWELYKAKEFRW